MTPPSPVSQSVASAAAVSRRPRRDANPLFSGACTHAHFERTAQHLLGQIVNSPSEAIVAVVGPSHVGKSSVARYVQSLLLTHYKAEMTADTSFVPFTHATLVWQRGVGLDFKGLYQTLLRNASEPVNPSHKFTALKLRGQLEAVAESRGIKVMFIDEGQQFTDAASDESALENLRAMKNLAVISNTRIVVCATYGILKRLGESPEIDARTWVVHLPHYEADPIKDGKVCGPWVRICEWFEARLRGKLDVSLASQSEEIRLQCGGRVGILARWLTRAAAIGAKDQARALTVTAPVQSHRKRWHEEVREGNELLAHYSADLKSGMFDPRHAKF